MGYKRKDSYYRRAKEACYRSRAAYKLIELDRRHRLFKPGARVLDLGCAPGGWLQVAAGRVGPSGRVVGMDRAELEDLGLSNVTVLRGDLTAKDAGSSMLHALGGRADLVLSDMAPDTSGVGFSDHVRSVELARTAAAVARVALRSGGNLVVKVFDGDELEQLVVDFKARFARVRRVRPDATRKSSRELYLVCEAFRG